MLLLFVLVAAAVVAFVVWRTLGPDQATTDRPVGPPPDRPDAPGHGSRPSVPRASGPDDDPDFLRSLDEKVKGRDDDPPGGSVGT